MVAVRMAQRISHCKAYWTENDIFAEVTAIDRSVEMMLLALAAHDLNTDGNGAIFNEAFSDDAYSFFLLYFDGNAIFFYCLMLGFIDL